MLLFDPLPSTLVHCKMSGKARCHISVNQMETIWFTLSKLRNKAASWPHCLMKPLFQTTITSNQITGTMKSLWCNLSEHLINPPTSQPLCGRVSDSTPTKIKWQCFKITTTKPLKLPIWHSRGVFIVLGQYFCWLPEFAKSVFLLGKDSSVNHRTLIRFTRESRSPVYILTIYLQITQRRRYFERWIFRPMKKNSQWYQAFINSQEGRRPKKLQL